MSRVFLLFILNIFDAIMTILNVGLGAIEISPVALWLLNHGTFTFFMAKVFIGTMACTLIALGIEVSRTSKLKHIVDVALFVYIIISIWHIAMFITLIM